MEQLKQDLLNKVNERLNSKESFLPLEAIYYVVKDFYRDVEDAYKNYLTQKQQQQNVQQKEEE